MSRSSIDVKQSVATITTTTTMTHLAHQLSDKERTRDIETDENVTFSDLLLSEQVLEGLHAAGFTRPSPIQLAAIPLGRCGLDLVIQAKSGTGKTCVLAVVALETVIASSPATQVVIVAPTREVAVQVSQVVSVLASAMSGLSTAAFIGGTKLADDKVKLDGCQVVVGTPGRLNQLVSLGLLKVQCVRLVVLDEADRLLEGNFLDPVNQLVKAFPLNKQMLCLSATFSDAAAAQAESLMRSPSHVRLDRESPALVGVNQVVCRLPSVTSTHKRQAAKEAELLRLLSQVIFNQCLVFSGSQLRAESVCHRLRAQGWPAEYLTAAQSQAERLAALEALCSHKCRILVATDLAARGLDSAHVNLVVSLDLPPEPATYLHRAGRAGRFGSRGAAVMLVCGPEEWYGIRAITTLANVRLLLAGKDWLTHLATKKVEGRIKILGNEEDDLNDQGNIKKKRIEKQDDNDKKGEENDKLELVDHLCEEEARKWLKQHKPYKKNSIQTATLHEKKQSRHQEKKEKPFKANQSNTENKMHNGINGENLSASKPTENRLEMNQEPNINEDKADHKKHHEEQQKNEENNCDVNNRLTQSYVNGGAKDDAIVSETDLNLSSKTTAMTLVNRLWEKHSLVTMSYSQLLSECERQYRECPLNPDMRVKVPSWPVKIEASHTEMDSVERCVKSVQEKVRERERSWDGRRFDASPVLQALSERRDAVKLLEEEREDFNSSTEIRSEKTSDEIQVLQATEVIDKSVAQKISQVSPITDKDKNELESLDNSSKIAKVKDEDVSKETNLQNSHVLSHCTNNSDESNHTVSHDISSPIIHKNTKESQSSNQLLNNIEIATTQNIPPSTTSVHRSPKQTGYGSQGARPKERNQCKKEHQDAPNNLHPQDHHIMDNSCLDTVSHLVQEMRKEHQDNEVTNHLSHHQDHQNENHMDNNYQKSDKLFTHQDKYSKERRKGQKGRDKHNHSYQDYHDKREYHDRDVLSEENYKYQSEKEMKKGRQSRNKHHHSYQDYHDRREYHDRNVVNEDDNYTQRKKEYHDSYANYNLQNHNSYPYNPWYPTESYQTTTNDNQSYLHQSYDYSDTYPNQYQSQNYYNQWYPNYDQHYYGYHHYAQSTPHIDTYVKNACKFASMIEYVSMMGRVSLQIAEDYHGRRRQWADEKVENGVSRKSEKDHKRRGRKGDQEL